MQRSQSRVFGPIQRWFGRLAARYVGMAKTHGQHMLEAIAYNLYKPRGSSCSRHSKNREKYSKEHLTLITWGQ